MYIKKYKLLNVILSERGQTIIEATVALSTILIILVAVTVAVTTALNNSTFIKNQSTASKYAQEGIERLRYIRNNYTSTFNNYNGVYCMPPSGVNVDPTTALTSGPCNPVASDFSGTLLRREVNISVGSANCSSGKEAVVEVYWSSGKCPSTTATTRYCHKTRLITCFSNSTVSGSQL